MTKIYDREWIPDTKTILVSLLDGYQWIPLLSDNFESDVFLRTLYRLGETDRREDVKLPTIKKIAELVGDSSSHVTKRIRRIYDDLWTLNEKNPELFCKDGEIRVTLCGSSRYYTNCFAFTTSLPALPRKYDRFDFLFSSGKVSEKFFYVDDVNFEYRYGTTTIFVELTSGFPEPYVDLLKQKAVFSHAIPVEVLWTIPNFELEDMLREYFRKGYATMPDPPKQHWEKH